MLKTDDDTDIGGYFRPNLVRLHKRLADNEFKKFASLQTNSERIAFIMACPETRDLSFEIENLLHKVSSKALRLKDEANTLFGKGQFLEALKTYSVAVLCAPTKDLGVILANRSATLHHLDHHDYALTDAEEALRVGYPKELYYKIEERRARCYLGLKRNNEAIDAFKRALTALDDAKISLEKKQKLETDIRLMLAVMDRSKQAPIAKQSAEKPATNKTNGLPKIAEYNPLYPAFSSAVEIKDGGRDIGRYGVATRNIEPGEVLAVEKAHCAALLAEFRVSLCHHCFSKVFVPMPAACGTCSYAAYCSIACRNADAELHKTECELLPPLWLSQASISCFLALRAIIQQPLEKLLKLKDELADTKIMGQVSEKRPYKGKDYQRFSGLVTHEDERSMEDIFHRTYMACWLLRLLKTSSYLPPDVKTPDTADAVLSEEELYVGSLLLHNLQLVQFNCHEVSQLFKTKQAVTYTKGTSLFIGGGVYPTVALLNHSCNPGIIRYFVGTTIVLRAVRTIAKGEEISENYGPIFTNVAKPERQRKLRLQYWFSCNCEACTWDWPLLDDIDPTILRFKCESGPSCGNILPVPTNTNEFMIKCSKCGKSTNILKGLKALQDTDALFKVANRNLEGGKHDKALKCYLDILKLLDETLALPIRDYHMCQEGVRLCMLTLGNCASV